MGNKYEMNSKHSTVNIQKLSHRAQYHGLLVGHICCVQDKNRCISKRPLFENHIYFVGISLRNITITGLAESVIFGHVGSRYDSVFTLVVFSREKT